MRERLEHVVVSVVAWNEMTWFGRRVCPVNVSSEDEEKHDVSFGSCEMEEDGNIQASDKHQQSVSFLISYSIACLVIMGAGDVSL